MQAKLNLHTSKTNEAATIVNNGAKLKIYTVFTF